MFGDEGGQLKWILEYYGLDCDKIIFYNDPKHKSEMTKEYIESISLNVLEWPVHWTLRQLESYEEETTLIREKIYPLSLLS